MASQRVRTTISYAVVFIFLVSFLCAGLQNSLPGSFGTVGELPLFSPDRAEEDIKGNLSHGPSTFLVLTSEQAFRTSVTSCI
jgi:hypothetical protein